jgi:hypothetical protein
MTSPQQGSLIKPYMPNSISATTWRSSAYNRVLEGGGHYADNVKPPQSLCRQFGLVEMEKNVTCV